ncbi:hypothetical protein FK513_28460, partial [Klebsiella pneumoniae]|nr:hypothetical protein [Klebsiella pneumoniae]
ADQKGGMRSQLEAANALQNLPYDIKWAEFPDRGSRQFYPVRGTRSRPAPPDSRSMRRAEEVPDRSANQRNDDHRRNKYGGDFIRQLADLRFAALRL